MKRGLLAAVLLLSLIGCSPHRVEDAVLRDTLFSVEETENGYWRIWMTHDDICGYCTNDVELGREALNMLREHHGEVLVYFRDITPDDPEFSWWSKSDCGTIVTGADSSTHMFLFYKLSPVLGRQ